MSQVACITENTFLKAEILQAFPKETDIQIKFFSSFEEVFTNEFNTLFDLVYIEMKKTGAKTDNVYELYKKAFLYKTNYVIIVPNHSESIVLESLEVGAIGYLLISEIRHFHSFTKLFLFGGSILTPTIAFHIQKKFETSRFMTQLQLSDLEKHIIHEFVRGRNTEEIAKSSQLSVTSVSRLVRRIFIKLTLIQEQI